VFSLRAATLIRSLCPQQELFELKSNLVYKLCIMTLTCEVCKSTSVVKDPVMCKVCQLVVAHPSCAAKQLKKGLPPQSTHLWTCRSCRAETTSTGSGADLQGAAGVGEQINALEATLLAAMENNSASTNRKLTDIETSLGFLNAKYDELLTTVKDQKALIVELRKDLEGVHQKVKQRDATVNELQLRVDQLEQCSLSLNLELHGVPEMPQIPLATTLQELAAKVGAPPPAQTVAEHFRLPGRPSRAAQGQRPLPGVVVLKFKEASARDAWIKGRQRLLPARPPRTGGEPGAAAPPPTAAEVTAGHQQPLHLAAPVRVYEQLTPRNKKLLFVARQAGQNKGYKFVWVRSGKIFARKDQGEVLIRIQSEDDIRKRMGFVLPIDNNSTD
jgi:hypothetical protein